MIDLNVDKHESYGNIDISRFSGNNSEFFGSDLYHNGGISITISNADRSKEYGRERIHSCEQLIR